jgi:cytochrome b6-f complex iron-sulfur subunit
VGYIPVVPSRRDLLALLVPVPLALIWVSLGKARRAAQPLQRRSLPRPRVEGVTIHGDVILVREGARTRAYSARCPHLGCRIDRSEGRTLVCPCHGSRFDDHGRRLGGPAQHDLAPLAVGRLDAETITVAVPD